MKLVKKFVLVAVFVSALSATAYAGDMETPGLVPPPSHLMSSTTSTTDETSYANTETTETSDILLYDALLTVLSLY